MQILAHPDDDLYFMNPELQQSIDANDQLVSVYVTSGEAEGFNKIPGHKPPKPNVANYAGARRQGLRQAYAFMATGDTKAAWTRQAITLPDGTPIEVDALSQHPGIRLIFLGVSQHFSPTAPPTATCGACGRTPARSRGPWWAPAPPSGPRTRSPAPG